MINIGIDVGGTNLKAGVVDSEGRILHTKKIPLGPWQDGDYGEYVIRYFSGKWLRVKNLV